MLSLNLSRAKFYYYWISAGAWMAESHISLRGACDDEVFYLMKDSLFTIIIPAQVGIHDGVLNLIRL